LLNLLLRLLLQPLDFFEFGTVMIKAMTVTKTVDVGAARTGLDNAVAPFAVRTRDSDGLDRWEKMGVAVTLLMLSKLDRGKAVESI
jgi:hypothetical protein